MRTRLRVVSAVVVVLALVAAACSSDSWEADTVSPESSTTPLPTTGIEAGFSNPVEVPGPVGPSVPLPRSGTPAAQPQPTPPPTDAPTEGPEPTALPRPEPEPQPDLDQTDNNFTAQQPDPADQQTSIISAGRGFRAESGLTARSSAGAVAGEGTSRSPPTMPTSPPSQPGPIMCVRSGRTRPPSAGAATDSARRSPLRASSPPSQQAASIRAGSKPTAPPSALVTDPHSPGV